MRKDPNERYQSATEMLRDLNAALKNPEGNFVENENIDMNRTQVMGTITDDMLEKNKKVEEHKKQSKLKQYFEHPKMKIVMLVAIFILVFVVTLFVTKFAMDAGTVKNVEIPELVGLTEDEVKEKLKGTKFTYEIEAEEYNSEVEAGKVSAQNPAYRKNFTIKENSKISLTISKGTELTTVPKVAGMEYSEAEKEITAKKLKIEKIEEKSDKIKEGYVTRQEPAENTELQAGETVKVYVSIGNGLEQVPVTFVVGKTEADARKELEDKKLKVEVKYDEDTSKTNGIVLKQSKDVGEVVEEGTTIVLTVNKISEVKKGTVNVNLKSILNYTKPTAVNEEVTVPKVAVKITVNGDTVYNEKQAKDTTKISTEVQGKGTVEVKIYVDDILKGTKNLDLNSSSPVITFE